MEVIVISGDEVYVQATGCYNRTRTGVGMVRIVQDGAGALTVTGGKPGGPPGKRVRAALALADAVARVAEATDATA